MAELRKVIKRIKRREAAGAVDIPTGIIKEPEDVQPRASIIRTTKNRVATRRFDKGGGAIS